jgi:hypothetical protein
MRKLLKNKLNNPLLIFSFVVVGLIESVWILSSHGFYIVDECAHFLYSRFMLQSLPITVETWHRPGRLWLFALPAQLGHVFTMFFCLALFLFLLFVTYRIAKLTGIKHAEWVVLLVGLQPILFDISYACLNEAPTALVIMLSYWFHLRKKFGWGLVIASLVFLFRFEMYSFAVLLFFVYLWKREWKILPLIFLGPLLWIGYSTIISGDVMTFFREWTRFSHLGKFVPGVSVTHYFENLQTIFGFGQVVLFAIGVFFITRAKRSVDYGIIYFTITINIIINTLTGAEAFHWTGSIGELRYVATIGPFWGIISVYGLSEILERIKTEWKRITFSVSVFSIVVFNCTLTTQPRRWTNYDQVTMTMTKAARTKYPHLPLLSNDCVAAYAIDVPPAGGFYFARLNKETLKKYPECLILWDPFLANSLFFQTEITKDMMLQDTTVKILEKYKYYNVEYLLLYKNVKSY